MTNEDAAREAVTTLGLLDQRAIPTIAKLLQDEMRDHPRTIAAAYRKDGEQLSNIEKRGLNIRANAFLSRSALAEITAAGLADPLAAHETTLLRATFTMKRARQVIGCEEHREKFGKNFVGYAHETLHRHCAACNKLDSLLVIEAREAVIVPPIDCVPGCTASYVIGPKVNWLAEVD